MASFVSRVLDKFPCATPEMLIFSDWLSSCVCIDFPQELEFIQAMTCGVFEKYYPALGALFVDCEVRPVYVHKVILQVIDCAGFMEVLVEFLLHVQADNQYQLSQT